MSTVEEIINSSDMPAASLIYEMNTVTSDHLPQEMQYALDVLALLASGSSDPIVIMTTHVNFAHALLYRLQEKDIWLVFLGDESLDLGLLSFSERIISDPIKPWPIRPSTIILGISEHADITNIISRASDALLPNGQLFTLAQGLPDRWLSKNSIGTYRLAHLIHSQLRVKGHILRTEYGLGAPISRVWGALATSALFFNRADLADRWYYRMRDSFVSKGWISRFALLRIIIHQTIA